MRTLKLAHLVHVTVILQIAVATLLLSLGESSPFLPLLSLAVLAASTYITDWKQRFELTQRQSDGLALAIMFLSAVAALRTDRQGLLVIVANLQSYLQYVLLFQRKTPRIYWQLALLSLGQVAIASTLVPGPAFGFLLLSYLLLGVVAFALLLLLTESSRLSPTEPGHVLERETLRDGAVGISAHGSNYLVLEGAALAVEPAVLGRGLARLALLVSALTVGLASLIFLALPRWGVSNYESTTVEPLRTVGFSSTVMLGELGEAIENPDVVMRVTFFRGRGDRSFKLAGEPLFRGTVVTRYEGRTWTQPLPSYPNDLPTDNGSTITRQRINIEPLDTAEVFHVAPAVVMEGPDPRLKIDPGTDQLHRLEDYRDKALEFDIGTTGIIGDRQRMVLPCTRPLRGGNIRKYRQLLQPFVRDNDQDRDEDVADEPAPLPRITELASQILADLGIDPQQDRVAAARALSDHFHKSGDFFYTLEPPEREQNLDPLEDFVSVHRGGHCEYFAGALVMLLRSQGIPARMVIGFKGGEWNDVGHYYQVQQLHAHAWVEAYLEGSQIPAGEFAGERQPEAAWLTLDPTEGTREGSAEIGTGVFARLRQSVDYARVLWINYVASLSAKRQKQDIYGPLAAGVEAAAENLTSVQVWQDRLDRLENSRLGKFWFWYRRHWFSWRGGLVAAGLLLVLMLATAAVRLAFRALLRRGWLGKSPESETTAVLEIYRRLEAALADMGLERQPAQTAREFALAAGGELAERIEHRRLAALPGRVVAAFYQVRFGGRPLGQPEAEAVESALTELELALGRPR